MSRDDAQTLEWADAPPERRRRRRWPWIVALLIVLALLVAAVFAAEVVARDIVKNTVRDLVVSQLGLPADQEVEVEVQGIVLPQLVAGTLDDLTIRSEDVTIGELTGDITANIRDVPVAGDAPASGGDAIVRLTSDQVRGLLGTVEGFPIESLALEPPDVSVSSAIEFFGVSFPVAVSLTPSAAGGDIVLTPAAVRLGEAEITADDLRSRFGGFADSVLRDYTVCIAEYIPAGLTLQQVEVQTGMLEARLSIDGSIIDDPALQAYGTCG